MNPGELRHRIVFEENRPVRDAAAGQVDHWVPVVECWAKVEPLSGLTAIEGMKATPKRTHQVTVRHRTDVHEAMRIAHRGRVFEIRGLLPDELGEALTISTEETVALPSPEPEAA
jgi:SPP1 family predicted phage head-tail adaptor